MKTWTRCIFAGCVKACALVGALALGAATLDVDLTISHGVYKDKGGESEDSRKVVYLVIDRSSSMLFPLKDSKRTRDEALLESLKMQLDAIPIGTEIHILPFSSKVWDEKVIDSLDESKRTSILDFVKKMVPKGQTVFYDAQDRALSAAAKIMEEDVTAEVRVLVYTDGSHETPWSYEGEYRACYHRPKKALGRKRWETNPSYQEELAAARKKFEDKFRGLISKPNMEMEYEWLSDSPKPEPQMRTKTAISLELASHTPELYNPLENPRQAFKGTLHLPLWDNCWDEVKGRPFTVEWTVGGKSATATLKLDSGRQKCSIEWPSLPEDNPEPATLTIRNLPEGRKFVLKDSKPVPYTIPALKRAEVTIASPADGSVFVVGEKVKFAVQSSEATVKWKFPSATAEGLAFEKAFDKEGVVKFSVTAGAGVRATTVARTIEIIQTGVELKGSANDYYEIGKPATFTAVAVGPALGYAWTVDGQAVAGGSATLDHVFKDTNSHEIGVTVRYKNDITASAKRTVGAWPTPVVDIVAPVAFDGASESSALKVGHAIDLVAKVEGAFESAVWSVALDDKVVATVPVVVKEGVATGSYTPAKGGLYDLTVTAKGAAGEKAGEGIQIYVNPQGR